MIRGQTFSFEATSKQIAASDPTNFLDLGETDSLPYSLSYYYYREEGKGYGVGENILPGAALPPHSAVRLCLTVRHQISLRLRLLIGGASD